MRAKYYRMGQVPPARHWYQRRIGWFGKLLTGTFVMSVLGLAGVGYVTMHNDQKSLAAETNQSEKLRKVTANQINNSGLENIIDVQYVLDKWSTDHPDQKFSVVAKSIDGPSFEAKLNQDKQYESLSVQKLFMLVPLFAQIPVEHQKNILVNAAGSQKSIATCVDLMLRLSSNECGTAVGDYLDWKKAGEALKKDGFTHTSFTNKNTNVRTTADDTATLLQKLNGDLLTRTARDTVLRSMKEQRIRTGIPSACPGCTVADKTDESDPVTHDAGIVQYSKGSYVLVIFAKGSSLQDIAKLSGQIQQKILDTTSN